MDLATKLEASHNGSVFEVLGELDFEHCVLPKEIEPRGLDRVMDTRFGAYLTEAYLSHGRF